MPMYRVFSCVVGRGCLLWPVCSLGNDSLGYDQCVFLFYQPLPCFILYSKAKFACYSRYFLTSCFCIPIPYNEKDIFFGVLVLEGLGGLHRTIQLQLLQHYWLGHRLGLLWYWMACLRNEQRPFCHFWDCIQVLHFRLVDYDGCSISSKGFLPTVVDIVVIWVKFTHSKSILVHWFLKCWCSLLPSPVWLLPICLY